MGIDANGDYVRYARKRLKSVEPEEPDDDTSNNEDDSEDEEANDDDVPDDGEQSAVSEPKIRTLDEIPTLELAGS